MHAYDTSPEGGGMRGEVRETLKRRLDETAVWANVDNVCIQKKKKKKKKKKKN